MKPSRANGERAGRALIAIGGNLPDGSGRDARAVCAAAASALPAATGLRMVALSRWWRSPAWPPSDQPDYVNGVALMEGGIEPADLLSRLQAMEAAFGRMRGVRNAARVLDLDIVAMGDIVRDAPDPVLPHPRARQRAFVLRPLADVAPDWVEPRTRLTLAALLAAVAAQACEPDPSSVVCSGPAAAERRRI